LPPSPRGGEGFFRHSPGEIVRNRPSPHTSCPFPPALDRRAFLLILAAGAVTALDVTAVQVRHIGQAAASPPSPPEPALAPLAPDPPLPPIPSPRPGRAHLVSKGDPMTNRIALTIDDGNCQECVDGYVAFAERTGIPITFNPNGMYRDLWDPHADQLRSLVARGQVQIANHTWTHLDTTRLSEPKLRSELERNEEWIERTFGVTSRPWYRPPFGKRNAYSDGVAARLGYTNILLWNGTLGDATELSREELLGNADRYFRAGNIVLGHANHRTVVDLFDQLHQLLVDRQLQPVTLDTMFQTSRLRG
jgi:peptidoglycan/xylan/chitin deacetylase (PgdA/CDA1 family)